MNEDRTEYLVATYSKERINKIFRYDALYAGDINEFTAFKINKITMQKDNQDEDIYVIEAEVYHPLPN